MSNFGGFRVLCGVLLALMVLANPRAQAGVSILNTFTVTNTNDSGTDSFRQAILDANSASGSNNIVFNIPGGGVHTIQPLTPLPSIDDPVSIDGASQPGYAGTPLIEISGVNLAGTTGLTITSHDCKIRALAVSSFGGDGIAITGNGANFNRIENCFVGTDAGGTVAQPNGTAAATDGVGIRILLGNNNTLFGNVISGNSEGGVSVDTVAFANTLEGNRIGTDRTGTTRLPNGQRGVILQSESFDTRLYNNLISGNDGHGVQLNNTHDNRLQGNAIGVDVTGNLALENQGVGVYLTDDNTAKISTDNTIGGQNSGEGNLLSGNRQDGIRIEGLNVTGTKIEGNFIGTSVTGDAIIANGDGGVAIINSANHTVGGPSVVVTPRRPGILGPHGLGPGNLISGNADDGVFLFGSNTATIQVEGNLIGTRLAADAPLANVLAGVVVRSGAHHVTITKNVISGNSQSGVSIDTNAHDNAVTTNRIGTNPGGTATVGQGGAGIRVDTGAFSNSLVDNVVSGNGGGGIALVGGASANTVYRNLVGLDKAGTVGLGNGGNGIQIEGGANKIGDPVQGGNAISANSQDGIAILQPASVQNQVRANVIGTSADGSKPRSNGRFGINVGLGALDNQIGGTSAADRNLIANNNQAGVSVGAATRIAILGNEIRSNGGLGIDLNQDAVTPNDGNDSDIGSNNLQNYPVLTLATSSGGNTTVTGGLDSAPNTMFQVEFFANVTADPSQHGEGEKLLGGISVTTDGAGHASFNQGFATGLPDLTSISATATDPDGNTSEFSQNVRVNEDVTPPVITNCQVTPMSLPASGGAVTISADVTDASGVGMVRARVTPPGPGGIGIGLPVDVTMTRVGATDTFQVTYTAPPNPGPNPAGYGVVVDARDNRSNPSAQPCGGFNVAAPDLTGPFLTNCNVIPRTLPSTGGPVLLRVDATDPSGVSTVRAVVTAPGPVVMNVTLSRQGSTDTFQGTYNAPPNATSGPQLYDVKFTADDNAGNQNSIPCGDFSVAPFGSTPPAIGNCGISPVTLPPAGGPVTITADVSDPDGVKSVQARISVPNGTVSILPLAHGSGSSYSATYSAPPNNDTADAVYTVFLVAKDNPGSTAVVRCGTFTVVQPDRTAPDVTACLVQPRNVPAAGGAVAITANVTDNVDVASVTAAITGPFGNSVVTLAGTGSNYATTFTAPPNTTGLDEAYQVTLEARDGAGNVATVNCGGFKVLRPDSELPSLTNCDVTPRTLLSPGGAVRFQATASDNAGIDRVLARITYPDSSVTTVPLAAQAGNLYTGTFTAPANADATPAVYAVTFDAFDTSGNPATVDCGTFTVAPPDSLAPVIANCRVTPRTFLASGGEAAITADVTDDVAVDQVRAAITLPDGSMFFVELARSSGSTYAGKYAVPMNGTANPQDYRVEIQARDTSGNPAKVDCGTFTVAIRDSVFPVLTNCGVSPRSLPAAGGTVTVTADATDNVSVKSMVAEFVRSDGSRLSLNLQSSGGSGYSGTIQLPSNTSATALDYQVAVLAEDPSANSVRMNCGTVTMAGVDLAAPTITNCAVAPGLLTFAGGAVTITADVTDDAAVSSVTAYVLRGGILDSTISLTTSSAPHYSASFAAHANRSGAAMEYTVELVARDLFGNARTVPCGSFTVAADTVPPAVIACDVTPRSLTGEGGAVVVTATVTDSIPIAGVVAVLRLDDGTERRVTLLLDTPDHFVGTAQLPENSSAVNRVYSVTIEAGDIAGNRGNTDCGTVTVPRAEGGKVQLSVTELPFGKVQAGTRFRRQFVIRNLSGSSRLAGEIAVLNAPFSVGVQSASSSSRALAGPTPGPQPFAVGPGGMVTVFVDFSPDQIRKYADRVVIRTTDPQKPEVKVKLSGIGCRNGRRR